MSNYHQNDRHNRNVSQANYREWDDDLRVPEGMTFAQMKENQTNSNAQYSSRKDKKA